MTATPRLVRVADVVTRAQTWDPRRGAPGSVFKYIDISSINKESKRIEKATEVAALDAPSRARQIVMAGDILVSTVRPNLNGVAEVPPNLDGATASTGFAVLRAVPSEAVGRYLFHWVRTPAFVAYLTRNATGASYPAVTERVVKDAMVPLPPLPEQKRVAEILDKADALREKRRRAIAELDEMLLSTFLTMFGDPATNPNGWRVAPLPELSEKFSDGPFGSNLKTEHYTESGIRVVRLQNIGVGSFLDSDKAYISPEHFRSLRRYHCYPGDVLIGTLGDPNLRACILPSRIGVALNKADCVLLRPDREKANGEYICWLLNTQSAIAMASGLIMGETRPRISMGRLKRLIVPVPPLGLQLAFKRIVDSVSRLHERSEESLRAIEDLFDALQRVHLA